MKATLNANLLLSHHSKIHFIGIGGSGMAPLAEVAYKLGFSISGSDQSRSDTVNYLQNLGINLTIGHSKKNIKGSENPIIVISSAIKNTNSELQEANRLGLTILHRSDLLNYFISTREKAVCVAGTNGKSTTSSMIAYLLSQLGKDPLAIIGAGLRNFNSLALCGKGEFAIVEADESDGSFLKYQPYVGVLTSVDYDHMDYFRDHSHIYTTFENYLSNIQKDGCAILNASDPHCVQLSNSFKGKKLSYAYNIPSEVRGSQYICKNRESYFLVEVGSKTYKVHTKTIGQHNVENALAAIASSLALGLDMKNVVEAFDGFSGVKRRLELIFNSPQLTIYDDYAHNPTKIQSVLQALRSSCPESNIVVIFQPHRYSRIKTLYNNFVGSFSNANSVVVLPIYSSGEEDSNPVALETLVSDIEKVSKIECSFASNFDSAQEKVISVIKENTIIITLGAGDVWRLAFKLRERLG